jgi:phosphopantetheine--protein transferase-like protein
MKDIEFIDVLGIGTDILNIRHITHSASSPTDPFVTKTFTKNEIDLILSRDNPLQCFATRFAGKEAVFKAINLHGESIRLNEIEILEDETGQPIVILWGKTKEKAEQNGITAVHLSLSYDTDYALAFSVAMSKQLRAELC